MSDAVLAAELMDELIGFRGVREGKTSMLRRAYELLIKQNRTGWQGRERRVRAIFDGEARRVDHFEIEDMRAVIEARKRHEARKTDRAERLAALRAEHDHAALAG